MKKRHHTKLFTKKKSTHLNRDIFSQDVYVSFQFEKILLIIENSIF